MWELGSESTLPIYCALSRDQSCTLPTTTSSIDLTSLNPTSTPALYSLSGVTSAHIDSQVVNSTDSETNIASNSSSVLTTRTASNITTLYPTPGLATTFTVSFDMQAPISNRNDSRTNITSTSMSALTTLTAPNNTDPGLATTFTVSSDMQAPISNRNDSRTNITSTSMSALTTLTAPNNTDPGLSCLSIP
ncbi:Hypothetical predicted protein [Pelobates cultripes]|uniref:Uncharacterized protein n=1 Tax=Pelobates cultripes TaxID=61616 RepID=A0AAD1SGJ6_PELCU|nr:Hypothetical predicted protein [Pelobates cultripes]